MSLLEEFYTYALEKDDFHLLTDAEKLNLQRSFAFAMYQASRILKPMQITNR